MIVASEQPYFAPYPGFLYKAHLADAIVILDAVQFPRGTTWISRNRFKNDRGQLWLTVPVDICRRLKASDFLVQKAALKYLDAEMFGDAGIALQPFKPPVCIYPQLWGSFLPNLSSFDLLFNCGPGSPEILLRRSPQRESALV
jgi:hypothetical protein